MKQYALIFRMNITDKEAQPTAEQMEQYMEDWGRWIDEITAADKLAGGHHFAPGGKMLRPGGKMEDGPYESNKESVAGYILVLGDKMDDAVAIARKCPILMGSGTSVEVRETANP